MIGLMMTRNNTTQQREEKTNKARDLKLERGFMTFRTEGFFVSFPPPPPPEISTGLCRSLCGCLARDSLNQEAKKTGIMNRDSLRNISPFTI